MGFPDSVAAPGEIGEDAFGDFGAGDESGSGGDCGLAAAGAVFGTRFHPAFSSSVSARLIRVDTEVLALRATMFRRSAVVHVQ